MNCPLETSETADLLLDYCARKLNPESTAILERHMAICPACREFAAAQSGVWSALDSWEAAPISADFDARLFARIENDLTWRERLSRSLRPLFAYRGIPAAAAACLILMAGVLLQRPARPTPEAPTPEMAVVEVQPEQVEKALDAMDVLSEFNRKAQPVNPESKL